MKHRVGDARVHQQLGTALLGFQQLPDDELAICTGQHLLAMFLPLWRVCTNPDANHFRASSPERNVFLDIALTLQHWPRNRSVNVDTATLKVGQDAFISCRSATAIVMFRQAV